MNAPTLPDEEWRPVEGFPRYWISSVGRVWSENSSRPRILRAGAAGEDGYLAVMLHKDKKSFTRYVSRLVCQAWHGPSPSRSHHAAHLDGNKFNNSPTNLAWTTPVENNGHKVLHGTLLRGSALWTSKLSNEQVLEIAANRTTSQRAAARKHGVSRRTISEIRNGRTWSWLTGVRGTGAAEKAARQQSR